MEEVNRLKDGDSFGHMSLLSNKPRNASIITTETTHFAVLSKKDYMRVLGMLQTRKLNEKIAFLWQIPVFRKLTKTSLAKLSEPFQTKVFNKTQRVFLEGNPADYFYIIKEGEVQLTRKTKSIGKFKEDKQDAFKVVRGEYTLKAIKKEQVLKNGCLKNNVVKYESAPLAKCG